MGIDVYARWKGQTQDELRLQNKVDFPKSGRFGYLRESYRGEPYATMVLAREAFDAGEAAIPAQTLRERLAKTLNAARIREWIVYQNFDPIQTAQILQCYTDFVELCERKELESGKPVTIVVSF